jgi:tetratricopeptide (TPR) repeat protein
MDAEYTTSNKPPPLNEHPIYIEGTAQIDSWQWQQAFESFQLLQGIYPENAEVQERLEDVQMRATLIQFQLKEGSYKTKRFNLRRFVVGIVVVIIMAMGAYVAYEFWIGPVLIQELRIQQITTLRDQADAAIAGGDYAQARQNLQQLQEILPEDLDAIEKLHQMERVERLSSMYSEARTLMAVGNWDQALEILTELESLDRHYRDLRQLLQTARASQALDIQFQAAEDAFARGDWAVAIAQYEALQQSDLTFRYDDTQTRLFTSHLNYGQTLLETAEDDSDRVDEILSHFLEALKLRPLDKKALDERRRAETYRSALNSPDQDEMIELLQTLYGEQSDYAGQAAANLLYITLLDRAASFLSSGNKTAAIADYEVAAGLLVEDPSAAQEKLVELTAE